MPTISKCLYCGKEFAFSPSKKRLYCSNECYRAATAYNQITICQTCGVEFTDQKHPNRKFCSPKCSAEAQKRRMIAYCKCGTAFETFATHPNKYCSDVCRRKFQPYPERGGKRDCICPTCGKHRRKRRDSRNDFCSLKCANEALKRPDLAIQLRCETCNKVYIVTPSYLKRRNSRYCSRACMNAGMSIQRMGANNVNYRGGSIEYRGANWRRQSRLARVRDDYKCQICGKRVGKTRHDHGVHHIKPYREFNGNWREANLLSNLITLCSSCHSKVEYGELPCPQSLL